MEQLPKIIETRSYPADIEIPGYIKDHNIAGRIVLPAVESCHLLASAINDNLPHSNTCLMTDALFDKFLDISHEEKIKKVIIERDICENGDIVARLLTKKKSKISGITRMITHAAIKFRQGNDKYIPENNNHDISCEKNYFKIPCEKIYGDIVPFGPAYQNITGELLLTEKETEARVIAGSPSTLSGPSGSPFPFDAALQAACVWGQRYRGVIAFPVGFDKRLILKPTIPGEKYKVRVYPVSTNRKTLVFDIMIYNPENSLCEAATGVRIMDISNGRVKPLEWIMEKG